MVLIKHSALVAAASGRIGSTIFSRNKSGVSVRSYRKGAKSTSAVATKRKNILRWLGVLWRTSIEYIFPVQFLPNPEFYSNLPHWSTVDCSLTYLNPSAILLVDSLAARGYAYSPVLNVTNESYYFVFQIQPVSDSIISKLRVYIQGYSPTVTESSNTYYDVSQPVTFGEKLYFSKPQIRVFVRCEGSGESIRLNYVYLYSVKDSFTKNWNTAAKNFPYSDRLGDSRSLTGQQLFTKLNFNMIELGLDPATNAPTKSILSGVSIQLVDITPLSFIVYFNESVMPDYTDILIYCTRTFPKSISAWKPQEMKLLRPKPEFNSGVVDCFVPFERTFGSGALISEGHVFLKISSFDTRTGERVKSVTKSFNVDA